MTDNEIEVGSLKTYVDTEDKAHFVFEGVVESNIPLLTNSQNFAEAINELFQEGTGANGAFRAVWDDNAGVLTIVVQEGEKYADYQFGYEYTDYSDEITTQTVVGTETVKTTRSFSKRIVTSLFDASGAVLLITDYNADNGVILGYTDNLGEAVHTAEWRDEYESVMTQSQGASSAAVAWVMARNTEQSTSLSEEKQAYKDGLKLGVDGGADITEEYEQNGKTSEILTDGDGRITEPFIGSFEDGIYHQASDGRYVCVWVDMGVETVMESTNSFGITTTTTLTGQVVFDAYNADGSLIVSERIEQTSADNAWKSENVYTNADGSFRSLFGQYTILFKVQSGGTYMTWLRWQQYDENGGKGTASSYYTMEPQNAIVREIIGNTIKVGNIPPDVIIN